MLLTRSCGGLVNCFLQSVHLLIFRSFAVVSRCNGSCLCFSNASKLVKEKQEKRTTNNGFGWWPELSATFYHGLADLTQRTVRVISRTLPFERMTAAIVFWFSNGVRYNNARDRYSVCKRASVRPPSAVLSVNFSVFVSSTSLAMSLPSNRQNAVSSIVPVDHA